MSRNPLVSVILPVCDRAALVGRSIESVLAQSFGDYELLVIDDGSSDGTAEVVRSYGTSVSLTSIPHGGAYRARNAGLEKARGTLLAFIDSDDVWFEEKLERQLPLLDDAAVGLVYSDALLVDYTRGAPRVRKYTAFANTKPRRGSRVSFAYGNFIPLSSVVARKECFDRTGGFDSEATLSADYLKWFQISRQWSVTFHPQPLFEYGIHQTNISSDLAGSLASRIDLFTRELASADGDEESEVRKILFNLALHAALARWRGYVVPRGPDVRFSPLELLRWSGGFALNQGRRVVRRGLSWLRPRRPRR